MCMNKKILFVDDEAIVAKTINKLLTKSGYFVTSCSSGAEAIKLLDKERFDLVISDIRMPDMTGVETIKKIRELCVHKNIPQIPEILISGFADPSTIKQAEALGARDFFYKPFDLQSFLSSVKKALE